ncbi:MAG TPA: AI-2E family transporter [Gammaproteobacteria bacterium]|nr:AI-2E family transporter [Gammaproteobacteria bacterium]
MQPATRRTLWLLGGLVATGWLVWLLAPVLGPFVIGAVIAYMTDPLVGRLEQHGLGRSGAAITVFIGTFGVLLIMLLIVVPLVVSETAVLLARVPEFFAWLQARLVPWIETTFGVELATGSLDRNELTELLATHFTSLAGMAAGTLSSLTSSGAALAGWIANLLLVPLLTFYFMRDWRGFVARVREILPRDVEPVVVRLAAECDTVLGAFLRGQMLVMACLGAFYSLGLWAVGLENALAIGVLAGLVSFVPYLGVIIGVVLAGLTALLQGPSLALFAGIAAVFTAGQLLEGFVLTPWLVGDRIGLHPVLVIFAIMAGAELFGFMGVLLALPVAAAGVVLVRYAYGAYRASDVYRGDATAPPAADGDAQR